MYCVLNLRSRNRVSIGFLAELIGKSASIESPETRFLEFALFEFAVQKPGFYRFFSSVDWKNQPQLKAQKPGFSKVQT